MTENLAEVIEQAIEENTPDVEIFSIIDFEQIVDAMFGNQELEWEVMVFVEKDNYYALKSMSEEFAYIFKGEDYGEAKSKEEMIDLILEIDKKYDDIKDRVKYTEKV